MAQLVQEAALVAVRKGHESILRSDLDDAVDRLTVGPKRVGIELGHQGQCRRATTEVGVAMTSHLLRQYENAKVECCDRISIIPRGQVLFLLLYLLSFIVPFFSFFFSFFFLLFFFGCVYRLISMSLLLFWVMMSKTDQLKLLQTCQLSFQINFNIQLHVVANLT